MTEDLPRRVGDALRATDYRHDTVLARLGETAHEGLLRNETTPAARRVHGSDDALSTLIRLFLLQRTVPAAAARAALPGLVDPLVDAGVLAVTGEQTRALMDVRPYAADGTDLWVLADLTPGMDGAPVRVDENYVLGLSQASTSLAQLTLRRPFEVAMDLGTGCGVQALHLATHCERVIATDVNPRALWVARFNAALNGFGNIEVRDGSLFEPLGEQSVDLIATNPPFVISPGSGPRLVYRDSGMPGDAIVEAIVRGAPARLRPDGWCQVLANWAITEQPWNERLDDWLDPRCEAVVVQREVLDPAAYVELWLKDSGAHGTPGYLQAYDTWLTWLQSQGVQGIGFGWITLHRSDSAQARHDYLDWPAPVDQPVAGALGDWVTALGQRPISDDDVAGLPLRVRADVRQLSDAIPGADDPERITLVQTRGLCRSQQVDTVLAAFVGASDGTLPAGALLDAVSSLLDLDPARTRQAALPQIANLWTAGFLTLD